jgi:hypothetical protein
MLTMGQAAKEAGTSKATISRAIAAGRLSASRNDRGGWDIQPAELFRVFPRNPGTGSSNGDVKQTDTPSKAHSATPETVENAALKAEIEGLRAMVQQLRENADDLKQQRDGWADQAKATQRILVDMRPKRGLFSFLKAG